VGAFLTLASDTTKVKERVVLMLPPEVDGEDDIREAKTRHWYRVATGGGMVWNSTKKRDEARIEGRENTIDPMQLWCCLILLRDTMMKKFF
jgi:hypothetical protein